MMKNMKNLFLLFYLIISLFLMEIILKVSTTGKLNLSNLLFSLLFSTTIAIIFYILCTFFKGKTGYVLSSLLLGLSAFIFSSQLVYYKFFKTFYTIYSAGNAGQIMEFWKDILILTGKNFIWIILFLIPCILVLAVGKKVLSFEKIKKSTRVILICSIILSHAISLAAVYISGREQDSAYDLYYKSNSPVLSVNKLGLLTTMRLDLKKLIFGLSSTAAASSGNVVNPPGVEPQDNPIEIEKKEYNIMKIDFTTLLSSEKSEILRNMHKYFESVRPTAKNEYTGKYKGYNLIFITAEGFSPYAVRQDVTPTLFKLVNEGYNFTNFYTPLWGVSTSDGEYVACTSLIPKNGIWSFEKSGSIYMPFVMGNQLKKLGYKTVAYHDHTYSFYRRDISHPNMGYDYKAVGKGLNLKKTWPESDLEMMQKTVPEYAGSKPFHAYYMTVSGHLRYTFTGNSMALKNKKYVQNLPYSENAKAYIACQIELDRALENLLSQLEATGAADNTLIAISPDHYPYGLEKKEIDELAGHSVEKNFELYKSTFILYAKGMKPVTIDKPCSSLDIIPTLSNLLGLEYDSRLLMGTDIFSDSDPLVVFLNKSFITDKGRYNSETGEFISNEGVKLDEDYVKRISSIIESKFYYSAKILETDYYRKVLGK